MKKIMTHYDNLQVSPQASPSVIRAAFKTLSQKWHPDKHQGNHDLAHKNFHIIKQAYDVLSDPASRQEYDREIKKTHAKETAATKNSKQISSYYSFKEKKTHISVIV